MNISTILVKKSLKISNQNLYFEQKHWDSKLIKYCPPQERPFLLYGQISDALRNGPPSREVTPSLL
jgi:hypothetical protein